MALFPILRQSLKSVESHKATVRRCVQLPPGINRIPLPDTEFEIVDRGIPNDRSEMFVEIEPGGEFRAIRKPFAAHRDKHRVVIYFFRERDALRKDSSDQIAFTGHV